MLGQAEEVKPDQLNLEAITVWTYKDYFVVEPNKKTTGITGNLRIDRKTHDITELDKQEAIPRQAQGKSSFSAFLGILPILNKHFLLMVEFCNRVCTIVGKDIYEVKMCKLVPFEVDEALVRDPEGNLTEKSMKINQRISKIAQYAQYLRDNLLYEGYYFSYGYDLSLSRASHSQGIPSKKKFLWNINIGRNLLKLGRWFVGIMQGFVRSFTVNLNGRKVQYFLITRRSWAKGGTRFNSRGIDIKGNVANFCETQQLIFIENLYFSHLQIRGSVPAFWRQVGLAQSVQFYKTSTDSEVSFSKHFQKLIRNYQRVFCLNLLCKEKDGQVDLTLYYERLIKQKKIKDVRYEYFDVHCACKGQNFQNCNYVVDKISGINKFFSFYREDISQQKVTLVQNGVVRVNCLDNLDRTNLLQSKIAYQVFTDILISCGFDLTSLLSASSLLIATEDAENTSVLVIHLKNVWADNGDMISKHYTGTGSTHTNVTRTGRRDIKGLMDHGLKTCRRLYQQFVEDNYKQEVIDILIGEHTETINLSQIEARIKTLGDDPQSTEPDYLSGSLVDSWNV